MHRTGNSEAGCDGSRGLTPLNEMFRAGCGFVIETGRYEGAAADVFQDIAKVVSHIENFATETRSRHQDVNL